MLHNNNFVGLSLLGSSLGWGSRPVILTKVHLLTTADPTATPPAVAAICLNKDGCCWVIVAWAGMAGGGWAGTELADLKYSISLKNIFKAVARFPTARKCDIFFGLPSRHSRSWAASSSSRHFVYLINKSQT